MLFNLNVEANDFKFQLGFCINQAEYFQKIESYISVGLAGIKYPSYELELGYGMGRVVFNKNGSDLPIMLNRVQGTIRYFLKNEKQINPYIGIQLSKATGYWEDQSIGGSLTSTGVSGETGFQYNFTRSFNLLCTTGYEIVGSEVREQFLDISDMDDLLAKETVHKLYINFALRVSF
ncbi:MAG: hypothetical protein KAX49_16865 [Halanaerobiales bacterium]|nr:hypothetical protein [Halanaerobiales bacterium]